MLTGWNKFLDSLNTPGGKLLILAFFVASLFVLVIHVLHHADSGQVTTVILATFSNFSGALLISLTGHQTPAKPDTLPLNGGGNGK
jgi:hypothetical protein